MRRSRAALAAGALLLAAPASGAAVPWTGVDCPPSLAGCVTAGSGGLDVSVGTPARGGGGPAGGSSGGRPAPAAGPRVVVERSTAPACTGNGPDHDLLLCASALARCPDGEVAVWSWTRTRRGSEPATAWHRELDPPVRCVGAGDARLPTAAALAAEARRAFRHLALPVPVVSAAPAGTTLVGLPTTLSVRVPGVVATTTTLLGVTVRVEARVLRTTWRTGDATAVAAGTEPLVHRYARPGRRVLRAAVEWGATYRVGDDRTAHPVLGTTSTSSAAVPLVVRTAGVRFVA